jgi:hypothetical protein
MYPQTPLEMLVALLSGSSTPKPKRRCVPITIVVDDGETAPLALALALAPAPATSQYRGRASQDRFLLATWHGRSFHWARRL